MSLREAIRTIVVARGSISFPYKKRYRDWMGTATISTLSSPDQTMYVIDIGGYRGLDTSNIDLAVNRFCGTVFTYANLALAIRYVRDTQPTGQDIDDIDPYDLKREVRRYWREVFPYEYPEFAGKAGGGSIRGTIDRRTSQR